VGVVDWLTLKRQSKCSRRRTVDKEYEEISRRYLERARQHTEELQAKWKEAMDKAIAFQEAFQETFKQEKDDGNF
jgi:hypothetical protein